MDKAGLVNKLAISAALAKIAAGKTLKSVVDVIAKALANNESVTLAGFGSFSVTTRATHTVRPPPSKKTAMDVKPGIWSRHWSTKAKSSGRMLAGCLCESPAVSISRQKRVQYRGLHGNIALFCSVVMVTAITEETAFPPPPEGRRSHAVILDESCQTDH